MRRRYVKRKEGLNILHRERGSRIAITNEENIKRLLKTLISKYDANRKKTGDNSSVRSI